MRKLSLFLSLLCLTLIATFAQAYTRTKGIEIQDDPAAITIVFINGIQNTPEDAASSSDELIRSLKSNGLPERKYNVTHLYNRANGFLGDDSELLDQAIISNAFLVEAGSDRGRYYKLLGQFYNEQSQKLGNLFGSRRRVVALAADYKRQVKEILRTSTSIILVTHSQGNFYAEAAYAMLQADGDEALLGKIRVVGVASVAATSPNGKYITHSEDMAVRDQGRQTALLSNYRPLPPNETGCEILDQCGDKVLWLLYDKMAHSFAEIYLNIDIKSQASGISFPKIIFNHISSALVELEHKSDIQPTGYNIADIGNVLPIAINDGGLIIARCDNFNKACYRLPGEEIWRRWDQFIGENSIVHSVNNNGQVVGQVGNKSFVSWSPGGNPLYLNFGPTTLPDGPNEPMSISNAGMIAGNAYRPDATEHAYLFRGGAVQDLGTLEGRSFSLASSVNDGGAVVGYSYTPGGILSPFIALSSETAPREISQVAGEGAAAIDINLKGQVVGITGFGRGTDIYHGFVYFRDPQTGVESLERIKDPLRPSAFVNVTGINDSGVIVGTITTGAFVHQNGEMRDLNLLIPQPSQWRMLGEARAINNVGQIVGTGILHTGETRAYLLTPIQ